MSAADGQLDEAGAITFASRRDLEQHMARVALGTILTGLTGLTGSMDRGLPRDRRTYERPQVFLRNPRHLQKSS